MATIPNDEKQIPLGQTDLKVSPLGVGAWAWGSRMYWGYGRSFTKKDVKATFEINLEAGINFFDTAEIYGRGESERLLGELLTKTERPLVITTKFFPYPWRLSARALRKALQASLRRLGLSRLDLYLIHWPNPPVSIDTWMNALGDAVDDGLTRAVGVSNYNNEQVKKAHTILAERGVPLSSNQVSYSLLDRRIERAGLLELCQELGVAVVAYSPLAQGLLTGKYKPETPPPGIRRLRSRDLSQLQTLIDHMEEIGQGHENKSPAQVALNWAISKGTIPIPGAKNARQATENIGALGWRLSPEEITSLERYAEMGS